jgi:hypothetical protein
MNELEKTASNFTTFYYAKLDDAEKRTELKDLYVRQANSIPKSCCADLFLSQTDTSMMTWEGDAILGQTNIVAKLAVSTVIIDAIDHEQP